MTESLELILAESPSAFERAARPYLESPEALDALLPGLVRETALRHYRAEYPKHVPHALFALLGGLEAHDLLDGPERTWPVLKALSYAAREKHLDPFPIRDFAPGGGAAELEAGLAGGDFETAWRAVRALLAGGRLDAVREALFASASLDRFNLGHRMIYAAKVLERLLLSPDLDAEALLFPVVHYHCLAPRDESRARFIEEEATLPPGGEKPLPGTCAETIRRVTCAGDPGATRTAVQRALGKKGDPGDLLDVVFQLSVCRLGSAGGAEWIPLAHVANYAAAARTWLATGTTEERFRAPYLAALFLADAIAELGPGETQDGPPAWTEDPGELIRELGRSVSQRRPTDARAATLGLLRRREWRPDLERALLLACARIEGRLTFGHDLKVVANAIRIARESRVPSIDSSLAGVASFLARRPPGDEMGRRLFPGIS